MGLFDNLRTKYVLKPMADYLVERNKTETPAINRAATGQPVLRDPMQFTDTYAPRKTKPQAEVPFDVLRRFSVQYDIARAAINHRKRQITQLQWEITSANPDDKTDYTNQINDVREFIKHVGGYRVRFREFLDLIVEDLLVLDAVAIYKRPTRDGSLYNLKVLDGSTIVMRVDKAGDTPEPPQIAYKQKIRGKIVAEFTADEMYYEMMNPRASTPYGLAPLESLVLGVGSALKSDVYNVNMLTEGNIPEGFFGVPETWTPQDIKEFQTIWDAQLAGNAAATSKLKFVPKGSYTPAVKPEDMRYKELQTWLMQKTCMLFDVNPNELGITDSVNKSVGEVQQDIGKQTGTIPTARFIQEILTDVIQQDLQLPYLRFKFLGLELENEKLRAETNTILINSGQRTIDEVRKKDGLEPIGVDKPFVLGNPTFIDEESVATRQAAAQALATLPTANSDDEGDVTEDETKSKKEDEPVEKSRNPEETHIQLVTELRGYRKYAIGRFKKGKSLRPFVSEVLPEKVTIEINRRLSEAKDADAAKEIFREYMQDFQINFLANLANLRSDLSKVLTDGSE